MLLRRAVGVDGGEREKEGGTAVAVVRPQRAAHAIEAPGNRVPDRRPIGARRTGARPAEGHQREPVVGVVVLHRADGGQERLLGRVDRRLVAVPRLLAEIAGRVAPDVEVLETVGHDQGPEPAAQQGTEGVVRISHVGRRGGGRRTEAFGPPGEIAAVAGHGADVRVDARGRLSEAERIVHDLDPEALVGAAVAGPASGDRGRDRSVVLDPACPQLRWEGIVRLGEPGQDRVVGRRCAAHPRASGRVQAIPNR